MTRLEALERALAKTTEDLLRVTRERDDANEALHRLANEMLLDKLGIATTHHEPSGYPGGEDQREFDEYEAGL